MAIKQNALRWWAYQIQKDIFVVFSDEIPDRRQREYLVKENLLFLAIKGYWVLKKPEDYVEDIFPLVYWQLIEKILSRLAPCSIFGKSALSLLSGDQKAQKNLSVKTAKKTNRKLLLPLDFDITFIYDPKFDERLTKSFDVMDRRISVDIPEKILIDVGKLKLGEEARGFIAGTKFNKRQIEVLYASNPKPFVFKRIIEMAKDAGRLDLASDLQQIIETYTHYKVGRKEKIDARAAVKPVLLKTPWVIRQEQQTKKFEELLQKKLGGEISGLKSHPLNKLIEQAKEHKKYDTYHSTTLEGYQVTPEQVEALLSADISKNQQSKGENLEQIKNNMAIVGYSKTFDFIIQKAQADFRKQIVSEELVADTYYYLFKPSVDAGIIDRQTLVGYRNNPVYIRGTRYIPPSHDKLAELMASFEFSMDKIKNSIIKAILIHYVFVTIHPYNDGNGRTGRLLMNYALLSSGYPWITIRAEQRIEYFSALNTANLKDDILPFGEFIVDLLRSVRE